jgi:MFS family permease
MATTFATTQETGQRIDYAAILPQRTEMIVLAGVLIGLFLAALDQTIVATALPAIIEDLNGFNLLSWVSTGYLLASTAMVPIYGKLSDLYGRKIILVWASRCFCLARCCAASPPPCSN